MITAVPPPNGEEIRNFQNWNSGTARTSSLEYASDPSPTRNPVVLGLRANFQSVSIVFSYLCPSVVPASTARITRNRFPP